MFNIIYNILKLILKNIVIDLIYFNLKIIKREKRDTRGKATIKDIDFTVKRNENDTYQVYF